MEKFGEPWADVAKCVDSDKGPSIMKHMGDMTHSLRPRVSFIPTVEIDGVSVRGGGEWGMGECMGVSKV